MILTNAILSQFSSGDDALSPVTLRPWSLGEHSYATNGKILVRVDRLADVAPPVDRKIEQTTAQIDGWLAKLAAAHRVPVPRIEVPAGKSWTCDQCEGRGCSCCECDGAGKWHQPVRVSWRGVHISRDLWLMIAALPGGTIAASPPLPPIYDHVSFAFDGGSGIVMPMRKPTIPQDVEPLIVDAEPGAQAA